MTTQIHPRITHAVKAMRQLALTNPEFLLPFARLRPLMVADDAIPTAAINAAGVIRLGTTTDALTHKQCQGRVCHEIMHLLMGHLPRMDRAFAQMAPEKRNPMLWNIAGDMLINSALKLCGFEHPATWIFLPSEYTGEKTTEAVYAWLQKEADGGSTHGQEKADGSNGCGCGVDPSDSKADGSADGSTNEPINAQQIANDMRALAKAFGNGRGAGSAAIADLLTLPAPRQNWQAVLRYGAARAVSGAVRDVRSYARLSRRPMLGLSRPGMLSTECRVAVVIDVSGSVSRDWVAQIVAECGKLVKSTPSMGMFVATHTDCLTWKGWIGAGAVEKLKTATAFTGGTDCTEAYAAVKAEGKFDVVIHFTDGDIYWPGQAEIPQGKLIIGLVGRTQCEVPTGAQIIPIC